eukprot:TRINITY_DN36293_c0_g1_i1.p1 TRINITY_DN36293_c0_g1~~TRINITY_DN36293_c0_g1_i1.p1  ORF type:complete len:231 (+),score=91.16 TRINITY_DN36293_c0_g1_i1:84-695(+)
MGGAAGAAAALAVLLPLCTAGAAQQPESMERKYDAYYRRTGEQFLEQTAQRQGVERLKSGLLVERLHSAAEEGAASPRKRDTCDVSFSGRLRDGTSIDGGRADIIPDQAIEGWSEALQLMCTGDKWRITLPPALAYGERGSAPKVPPHSPLVFDIELHKVTAAGSGTPRDCSAARAAYRAAAAEAPAAPGATGAPTGGAGGEL